MVMCLGQGADLHMAQLMPMPLTISCSSKSRLVLPSWFYLSAAGTPGQSWTKSKWAVKRLCVCVLYTANKLHINHPGTYNYRHTALSATRFAEQVTWAPPVGSGAEPQPKSNFVHFNLKVWRLVAAILVIFLRINWPNLVHFEHPLPSHPLPSLALRSRTP